MSVNLVLPLLAAATVFQGDASELIEELDAAANRTGSIRLSMTPIDVLGEADAARLNPLLLATERIEWHAYVPRNFDPKSPPGLLVFVGPGNRGRIPAQWQSLMDEHNLIWIGASDTGSPASIDQRVIKSLLAPRAIDIDYPIDADRVFIGGFADGGQIASLAQRTEPHVFRGGLYICGAHFDESDAPRKLAKIRSSRHVFIRGCFGSRDRRIERIHSAYKAAGIQHAELITVEPGRQSLPGVNIIDDAIRYLEKTETADLD